MELVEIGTGATIYEPLRKDQNEIRLLTLFSVSRIHKGRFAHRTSVSCNLTSAALSEHLKYDAISYSWDTGFDEADGEEFPRLIELNGNLVRIGRNLHDFLVRLQRFRIDRVVWVDALCINQGDVTERNHQVHIMKTVYRNAGMVVAWLGPEARDSDMVIDAMNAMENHDEENHDEENHDEENPFFMTRYPPDPQGVELSKFLMGVHALSSRRYWSRLWIVQEILLARKVILYCGTRFIPWQLFIRSLKRISGEETRTARFGHRFPQAFRHTIDPEGSLGERMLSDAIQGTFSVGYQQPLGLERSFRDSLTLESALEEYSHCRCREPRDMVFGLLGIVNECNDDRVAHFVDYDVSTEELFFRILEFMRPVNFLRACQTLARALLLTFDPLSIFPLNGILHQNIRITVGLCTVIPWTNADGPVVGLPTEPRGFSTSSLGLIEEDSSIARDLQISAPLIRYGTRGNWRCFYFDKANLSHPDLCAIHRPHNKSVFSLGCQAQHKPVTVSIPRTLLCDLLDQQRLSNEWSPKYILADLVVLYSEARVDQPFGVSPDI